jgi:hypothetical protein
MSNDAVTARSGEDAAQEIVVIDTQDREYFEQIAAENGVSLEEIDESGFIDPITVSFIIIGAAAAISLVQFLIDKHKGGMVLDSRPGAPRPMYRSKDVDYGLVVIYAVDGKVEVQVKEPRGLFGQVIDALTSIIGKQMGSSAGDLAKAAGKAVGTDADVTVKTAPAA